MHLLDQAGADALADAIGSSDFRVLSAEEKPFTRSPYPPFITSTLQQEGSRKLRFDARRTMRAAQRLYENGYITYMRTDSVVLSDLALEQTRQAVRDQYGAEYLPDEPRRYRGKVQNAQEAHEAIRPAGDPVPTVDHIRAKIGEDEARLFDLIWKRTIACQMKDAKGRRMVLKVHGVARHTDGTEQEVVFQANGNVIDFPGFLRAYVEGTDDPEAALADKETILPAVSEGETSRLDAVERDEHHTTPPRAPDRGDPGQGPGGVRHRPPVHLRLDHRHDPASRLRVQEGLGPGADLHGLRGGDPDGEPPRGPDRHGLHPPHGGAPGRHLPRGGAVGAVPARVLLRPGRGDGEAGAAEGSNGEANGEAGQADGLKPLIERHKDEIDARVVNTIPIGEFEDEAVVVRVGRYGPYVQRGESTAPIPDETCPDEMTSTTPWT